jgi:hypothetical protein
MLASVAELAAYMDRTLTNRQEDNAALVLAGVQAEVEAELNRPVEVREFTEDYVVEDTYTPIWSSSYFYDRTLDRADGLSRYVMPPYMLSLRNSPVVAVSEVVLTPMNNPAGAFTLVDGTHYVVRRWGLDVFACGRNDLLTVTYEAGLADNAAVKQVILRAAAREMQNMTDDVLGLKDFQNRGATVAEVGLTDADRKTLRRFKRKKP